MSHWSTADIPDLSGRTAVVTGANSGIGFLTALELARHGADVTVAGRSPDRIRAAVEEIRRKAPATRTEPGTLDLGDLSSIRAFADDFTARHDGLHLLVNNAGVAFTPYARTADGFESHLGINHLGHFALTGLLLPLLLPGDDARVVTVASDVHERTSAQLDFDDLGFENSYRRLTAYARSKLANLLFVQELHRRLTTAGLPLRSVAANPGMTRTNLGPRLPGRRLLMGLLSPLMQPASVGAAPTLYAATAPDAHGGDYFQPDGKNGPPVRHRGAPWVYDEESAGRLWEISESLTRVSFDLGVRPRTRE